MSKNKVAASIFHTVCGLCTAIGGNERACLDG